METALNAVWDGAPGPADRIVVIGAGVIGALIAFLCRQIPGVEVTLVDVNTARANIARTLGVAFAAPDQAPIDCDLVFHASATAAGLATAIACAGEESTIVELSWYGEAVYPCRSVLRFTADGCALFPARSDRCLLRAVADGRPSSVSPLQSGFCTMTTWTR